MIRKDGSPHHGFLRSPSWSKGRSVLRAIPPVLIKATVQSDSGLARGVQGMSRGDSRLIHDLISLLVMPSRKRYESTIFAMNAPPRIFYGRPAIVQSSVPSRS